MRENTVVFFMFLMGLSFAIVKGQGDHLQKGFEEINDLELPNNTLELLSNGSSSENVLSMVWMRLQHAVGVISGPYLSSKLGELVKEHPMRSMIFAIIIGIITNENKKNIIEGIKKLRNSAYRVIGFGLKSNKENKKDEQKKEIKFVECANLDNGNKPNLGKLFVLDA